MFITELGNVYTEKCTQLRVTKAGCRGADGRIHVVVFWVMTPFSDVVGNQRFGGPFF
jgi:hypothetical protein